MKIMAKLGICTLRSYVGAQTFESLGLATDVVQTCFPAMHAHVPAIGFAELEEDVRAWHLDAETQEGPLPDLGLFRFRRDGRPPRVRPQRDQAVARDGYRRRTMRPSSASPTRSRDARRSRFAICSTCRNRSVRRRSTASSRTSRSLAALRPQQCRSVPSDPRFTRRSRERQTSPARAATRGEGGEDSKRFARGKDNARSRIKQVASARFGVGVTYLESADEIEIKIAQGSKPGEGGQIPAHKVTQEIARLRGASAGQALISPPPHHDIYSIEDLAQLIYDLRRAAPHARIAVKLVAQHGIGAVASGVAKAGADVIHISGHDGGTGASPLGSIKHAGLPWELGLAEVHEMLTVNGLRSRVALRVDGGLKNGRDVIVAALLGADQFGFGSALLVALGCIYARQCHKNTCPVGIATQDAQLREKFKGTPEQGATFFEFVARDVRRRLAALGATSLQSIRGRRELLRRRHFDDPVLQNVNLRALTEPVAPQIVPEGDRPPDRAHVDDAVVLPWETGDPTQAVVRLRPADRAVGARIAYRYVRREIESGESPEPMALQYVGTAGQSFGAFLTGGIALSLSGEANDYVGKSMEGGRIVVVGPGTSGEPAIGNTCFYGARGGQAYIRGAAGERFCVRNSGASVVVEGAGDHACEYMTAGVAVILGAVGRNVASGMTGGTLFLLADEDTRIDLGPHHTTIGRCAPDDDGIETLHTLLHEHVRLTGSAIGRELLHDWPNGASRFLKFASAVVQPVGHP